MIVQVDYVVCYRTESCLRDKNSTVSANWLIHIPNFQWPQGILNDPLRSKMIFIIQGNHFDNHIQQARVHCHHPAQLGFEMF